MKNLFSPILRRFRERTSRLKAEKTARLQHERRVAEVVEHVVDQVDPRLRAVAGYRKRLFPVIERCLAHAERLAARVPGPVEVSRRSWAEDPYVNALFGSVERIRWVLSGPEVRKYVAAHPLEEACYAVLASTPEVKRQLGMELAGEHVQRDVRQTAVSVADHEVGLVAESEEKTRTQMAEIAIEVMVSIAVEQIAQRESRIAEIEERLRVVRVKRKVVDAGSRGAAFFLEGSAAHSEEMQALDARIRELETELSEAKKGLSGLGDYLDCLVELLQRAEERLGLVEGTVRLDRMNIVRGGGEDVVANEIAFMRARRGETPARVITLIRFPRTELLSDEERLRGLERYLG
jgi:hypothetical protein